MKCNNCPRNCGVNRSEKLGYCKLNNKIKIAKACLHFGEEPIISGKKGSGTIFFSGCTLKCVFCQNFMLSHQNFGKEISVKRLAEIFKQLENKGAHNINLVTPTAFVDKIINPVSKDELGVTYLKYIGNMNTAATIEILKLTNS